jgi:hypothetical protein
LPIGSVQSSVFDGNSAVIKYLAENFDIFLAKYRFLIGQRLMQVDKLHFHKEIENIRAFQTS